jgi:serine/threonine protein phosphatase PrpC
MHAFHQDQGMREYMEDYVDIHMNIHDSYDYYAVFDGHGGKEVALYLQQNLWHFLKDNLVSGMGVKESLHSAFEIAAANIDAQYVGSTALVVLVGKHDIWIANTGDCRAVLNKFENYKYTGIPLTQDHKPNHPDELKRIYEVGGSVVSDYFGVPRVNAYLAVSRSFGDMHIAPAVTWKPDVYHLPRIADMRSLILASDGLWDVMSNQDVVDITNKVINSIMTFDRVRTMQAIVKTLTDTALERGSMDNISVVFIMV